MEAEVRDILRDVVKADDEPGCLGTEISDLFKGAGFKEGEEFPALRNVSLQNPFGE